MSDDERPWRPGERRFVRPVTAGVRRYVCINNVIYVTERGTWIPRAESNFVKSITTLFTLGATEVFSPHVSVSEGL